LVAILDLAHALHRREENLVTHEPGDVIRIGVLTPHASPGPKEEFSEIAPGRLDTRIAHVGPVGDPPITPPSLRTLTAAAVLDAAAETLRSSPIDAIAYASTTSAYVIGFDAELTVLSRLAVRLEIPVLGTCASAVQALRLFDVERLAVIGAPWFSAELNDLGATYFRSQGFDVVFSRSADLSQDPSRIEAGAVHKWTSQHVGDDAQAMFIGGNGFRAAAAIESLETTTARLVLTSNQVLLWSLLRRIGASWEISGFGRLFACRSTTA
jgi:maleate isomerase